MTKNEAKETALRWIDEATVNGRQAEPEELADYRDRMDYLLDGVQTALAAAFPLDGCFAATICPVPNLLSGAHALRAVAPGEPLVLNAAGDTELDCAPQAESLIPLKLAADTLMGTPDRAGTAYYLENCYSTRLQMLRSVQTEAPVRIEPVYR